MSLSLSDFAKPTRPAILLVGPPKSAKTTLALQFPKPWLADCDGNLSGPARFLAKANPTALTSAVVESMLVKEDGTEIPERDRWENLAKKSIAAATAKNADGTSTYETIILDGLTWSQIFLQQHIFLRDSKKTMELQHWQPFQHMLMKFIMTVRTSNKTVIYIAHEEVDKGEGETTFKYFVAMPTRLRSTFGGLFTDFWRAEYLPGTGGDIGKYQIRTMAKANFEGLGNSLGMPPTIPADYKLIAPYLS